LKLHIVIPTLNRQAKLLTAIGSIAQAREQIEDNVLLYIYYSNSIEFERDNEGYKQFPWILTRLLEKEYNTSEFWNEHIKEHIFDILLYLNDDIILEINCLKNIVDIFNKEYPDLDGVIGIRQSNLPVDQALQTAFGAIGTKFADRFPNRQVFCPLYKRFYGDRELYEYTTKIGKLYFNENGGPELMHLHPAFDSKQLDETHHEVRKFLNKDRIKYAQRHEKGLLWGETYEL
jgi:hypothetical protein